jgi:glycosyltransferase involved in cell wall biosynthesis
MIAHAEVLPHAPRTIVHLTENGDTSGYFPQLARHHDRHRYRMIFATLKPIEPRLREYMETQQIPWFSLDCESRLSYPLALARLVRFLRREKVDILHTHLFDPSVVGLCGGFLARTPIRVMTRHYSDYHTRIRKRWHVRIDQLCTALSSAVIAVSQHTADHLVRREGAPSLKVHAIPNGIDFTRVRPSSDEAAARLRREYAPNGEHLLLVPARLHPEKGHEFLFQAIAALRGRAGRSVILLAAGVGPYESGYRERVRELGCEASVRFLGFRQDLPDLMRAVDLVVVPSVAEAFGLVLAEALYLGVPVIASRVGGIPEIIDDGTDGVLTPPGDSDALATAIHDLLMDPTRRETMGRQGREKVMARFRFEDMMSSYESLYERLAAERRS